MVGYIASPWEPRILVVVLEERFVLGGSVLYLRLFGSHLRVGFESQRTPQGVDLTGSYAHEAGIATIELTQSRDGTIDLSGYAEWPTPGGSVNVAELAGVAVYAGARGYYRDESGCELELTLSSEFIEVTERAPCGGLNASFTGRYRRVRE